MTARFEIFEDGWGDFRYQLCADSGEILATCQPFPSVEAAREGLAAVRQAILDVFDLEPKSASPLPLRHGSLVSTPAG